MELNSLTIYTKLNHNDFIDHVDLLADFLLKKDIADISINQMLKSFKNNGFKELCSVANCLRTGFFYSKLLGLKTEILFRSEYYSRFSTETYRWVCFDFLFKTTSLGIDSVNEEVMESDFKYSEEKINKIKAVASELFEIFKDTYIFFTHEYQGVSMLSNEHEIKNNEKLSSDFEFAMIPPGHLSDRIDRNVYTFIDQGDKHTFFAKSSIY